MGKGHVPEEAKKSTSGTAESSSDSGPRGAGVGPRGDNKATNVPREMPPCRVAVSPPLQSHPTRPSLLLHRPPSLPPYALRPVLRNEALGKSSGTIINLMWHFTPHYNNIWGMKNYPFRWRPLFTELSTTKRGRRKEERCRPYHIITDAERLGASQPSPSPSPPI